MSDVLFDVEKYWILIGVLVYIASCLTSYGLGYNKGRESMNVSVSLESISFKSFLALKYLNEMNDELDTIVNMTNEFGESVVSFLLADGYIGLVMKSETPCVHLTVDGKSVLSSVKFAKLP